MKKSDFYFDLPEELIAQTPLERRDASRLLTLDKTTGAVAHHHFYELPQFLRPNDCLVLNDSRVLPARLLGSNLHFRELLRKIGQLPAGNAGQRRRHQENAAQQRAELFHPPAGHKRAHKRTQKRRRAKRYQILPDCIHHPPTAFKKHAEDTRLIQSVLAAIASM